jgi:photosystem II stability/assembly factor-like uncharacterized protein
MNMAEKTFVYVGAEASGLYRKEAGDQQWQALTTGMPPSPQARAIAIHPQAPAVLFVGTQRGVYRSQDGGDSWRRMDLPEGRIVWSLAFHPHTPQVMFLGTEGSEVYRSDDGGEHWQYLSTIANPEAVQMAFATRILGLAIEPADPNRMYAALEVGGAARSFDGGKTWQLLNRQFVGDVDLMDLHGVALGSPRADAVFIANRVGVWRSRDRGDHWENVHLEKFSPICYSRGVRVAPNDPNTLYACVGRNFGSEEGSVLRSTDLGETWERFDRNVTVGSTTFGVAINAQHSEQVYFCTRRGQVFGTHDSGASWKEHRLPESASNVISVACASRL